MTNGLGFLPYSNSPHHDAEEQRRPTIHRLIGDGTLPDGYATDNGTGLVFEGTSWWTASPRWTGRSTWRITRLPDGTVEETALPTRLLESSPATAAWPSVPRVHEGLDVGQGAVGDLPGPGVAVGQHLAEVAGIGGELAAAARAAGGAAR